MTTAPRITRILPVSDRALLVEYEGLDAVLAHFAALGDAGLAGVEELIPAAATIMVRYDPTLVGPRALAERIRAVGAAEHAASEHDTVTVDVVYTGEDLDEVAAVLDVSREELIRRHTGATWRGAFAGFAPGFVYCVGDDPLFSVPRRASPRTRIPAGAVAVAGNFSAVYPRTSPGGWQLLGRTPERMWDLDRTPPAFIQPGQEVRYRAVRDEVDLSGAAPRETELPTVAPDARALEVVRPGAQLLLQDLGRPGMLGIGVAASGAADRRALRAANRVVGNEPGTAARELAGGGAELRVRAAGVVAWTGASGRRRVVGADGAEFPLERGVPTAVEPGDTIHLGGFSRGLRGYLAVRGGFAVPDVLGSLTTDTLSGVGPQPLRAGDVLPLGGTEAAHAVAPNDAPRPELPGPDDVVDLDIVLGPRTDWFTPAAVETLTSQEWLVTPQSDRVGLRLEGEVPLERAVTDELPSEGAATGAIQVPANGQPVLFLPDHPLTGGYPVIGAVRDADLDLAGQLAPGMRVRFRVVHRFAEL
jgi:KipI family sensor histidine kinase inhibitor